MLDTDNKKELQKYNTISEIKNEVNGTFAHLKALEYEFRGKDIIYSQRFEDWQILVEKCVSGDYYGKDLDFALNLLEMLSKNEGYKAVKNELNSHEYFTFSKESILDILLNFSKCGPDFVESVADKEYLSANMVLINYMKDYNKQCKEDSIARPGIIWERNMILEKIEFRNKLMAEFKEWQKTSQALIPTAKWKSWNEQMLLATCSDNPEPIRLAIKIMQILKDNPDFKKVVELFENIVPETSIQFDVKDLILNYAIDGPDFIEYYDGWQVTTEELDLINELRMNNEFHDEEFEDTFLNEIDIDVIANNNYDNDLNNYNQKFGNIDDIEI